MQSFCHRKHKSFYRIALFCMPSFPTLSDDMKEIIACDVEQFIQKQITLQPMYIRVALRISALIFDFLIQLIGPKATNVLCNIPFGGMVERLFRSLTTLVFYENSEVLNLLGEENGIERIQRFRRIRNGE